MWRTRKTLRSECFLLLLLWQCNNCRRKLQQVLIFIFQQDSENHLFKANVFWSNDRSEKSIRENEISCMYVSEVIKHTIIRCVTKYRSSYGICRPNILTFPPPHILCHFGCHCDLLRISFPYPCCFIGVR